MVRMPPLNLFIQLGPVQDIAGTKLGLPDQQCLDRAAGYHDGVGGLRSRQTHPQLEAFHELSLSAVERIAYCSRRCFKLRIKFTCLNGSLDHFQRRNEFRRASDFNGKLPL